MKIIVDGFGGDNAPLAVLEGCAAAVKEYGVELIVTGGESIIKKTAAEHRISLDKIEIVHELFVYFDLVTVPQFDCFLLCFFHKSLS